MQPQHESAAALGCAHPCNKLAAATAAAGFLAPLLHALQFLGDLGAHEVIDGDAIHIYQQASRDARHAGRGHCSALPAALRCCCAQCLLLQAPVCRLQLHMPALRLYGVQEQVVHREGLSWRKAYCMPAAADRWECAAAVQLCSIAAIIAVTRSGQRYLAAPFPLAGSTLQGCGAAAPLAGREGGRRPAVRPGSCICVSARHQPGQNYLAGEGMHQCQTPRLHSGSAVAATPFGMTRANEHAACALPQAPAPAPLSRRQVLDRYEQHTRHCPSCRKVGCAAGCAGTPAALAPLLPLAVLSCDWALQRRANMLLRPAACTAACRRSAL